MSVVEVDDLMDRLRNTYKVFLKEVERNARRQGMRIESDESLESSKKSCDWIDACKIRSRNRCFADWLYGASTVATVLFPFAGNQLKLYVELPNPVHCGSRHLLACFVLFLCYVDNSVSEVIRCSIAFDLLVKSLTVQVSAICIKFDVLASCLHCAWIVSV